jgi:hypothetical protein
MIPCERITKTRLLSKFGRPQDRYADWEIQQTCDELEAEGANPPKPLELRAATPVPV